MNHFKTIAAAAITILAISIAGAAAAGTKAEINAKSDAALVSFNEKVKGGDAILKSAKGYLVFPSIVKAGLGIGGETGDGVLRVGGKTVAYYNTSAGSIGFQMGVQERSEIIAFMDDASLTKFRNSKGWTAGVDGSVALVTLGAGGEVDTATMNKPIIGFVFGNSGLMFNLTIEGSKMTQIHPK